MKIPLLPALRIAALASFLAAGLAAQTPAPKISFPALSPTASVKQKVALGEVTIDYSRPSVKGRKIFGALEPYGEVWRTGANSATKITFSTAVKIEGRELPAGAYALYSIPGAKEWTVIFNKVTGEWGAYSYKQENDALRVQVKPIALSQVVETFTIDLNDLRADSATLNLLWEKTRVPVKLQFDIVQDVVAQIDAAMASGAKLPATTYFSAAQFYYENGLDLKKARTWIDEATKGDKPPFFMLYWKARILAKLGDKPGAIAAAKQSIAAAEGAPKSEYIRLNETLIASLK
jgi:hypothetical protein